MRGLIVVATGCCGRSMAAACAISVLLWGGGTQAVGAIKQCKANEERCTEAPAGSRVIAAPAADAWGRRATEALLSEDARELAKWSRESVVVATDIAVRMPRHYRLVGSRTAGEAALLACGRERLLLVVAKREIRETPDGRVIADLQVDEFGATCDRSNRTIFQHGTDWYRVVMVKGRVTVFRTVSLAI
jgi:hypothetical protein